MRCYCGHKQFATATLRVFSYVADNVNMLFNVVRSECNASRFISPPYCTVFIGLVQEFVYCHRGTFFDSPTYFCPFCIGKTKDSYTPLMTPLAFATRLNDFYCLIFMCVSLWKLNDMICFLRLHVQLMDLQQKQINALAEWLTLAEQKINSCESIGSDLDTVKRQVEDHKVWNLIPVSILYAAPVVVFGTCLSLFAKYSIFSSPL